MTSSHSSIYSQSFNFDSFLEKGVDPRTGHYNPLNTSDVGLGTGWSFTLPVYDPRSKTLVLSTGENFKVIETSSLFLNGRSIQFSWAPSGSEPQLKKILDGDHTLLEIQYQAAQVKIIREPGSPDESFFTLVKRNGQLVAINLPEENMPPWQFEYQRLVSPTGLIEEINYKRDGHLLPRRAPYPTIPYVISHVVRPGRQQPAIRTSYSYSGQNFLGNGGGRDWSADGDTLYLTPAEYQIRREYNKFHLPVKVEEQKGSKKMTQKIIYHALLNRAFDDQPAQYLLPKTTEITYSDTVTKEERTETTTTMFDEWGNPTDDIKPDAAGEKQGDEILCPADPHGFQRYMKTEMVTPAESRYSAPTRGEEFKYLELSAATGALVGTFVALKQRTTRHEYIHEPASRNHGRMQQQKTWLSENRHTTSSWTYDYPGENELRETLTTTTFDGIVSRDSQVDDAEVEDALEYDKLGRLIKATTAAGTEYEAVRQTQYSSNQDGSGLVITVTDSKERTCQVKKQDCDYRDASTNMSDCAFRIIQECKYNAQGQRIEQTEVDWLSTMEGGLLEQRSHQRIDYDDWGQVYKSTDDTGMATLAITDPINLTRTEELLQRDGIMHSKIEYRHDGLGRLVEEEDASGHITKYEADHFDRVVRITAPNGRIVNIEYPAQSAAALPTSVRIGNTNSSSQTSIGNQVFDGLDRIVQRTIGGRSTAQAYQGSSPEPTQITFNSGDTSTLTYEPNLGLAVAGVQGQGRDDAFIYDHKNGAPRQLKNVSGTRDVDYYPSGLLKSEIIKMNDKPAVHTNATYSLNGKLQSYTDVHGRQYGNEYDSSGRLKSLTLGTVSVSFSYDTANRLSETIATDSTHNTDLITNLVHDDFGREVERTVARGEKPLYKLTQSYNQLGLIATKRLVDGNGALLRSEAFEYDSQNRLVVYTCDGSKAPVDEAGNQLSRQQFVFDDFDNLVSVTTKFQDGSDNTANYSHGEDPTQLIQITNTHADSAAEINLEYDANGCLVHDEKGRSLEYDTASRLKVVRDPNGNIISQYSYDASGRLISQTVPGQPDLDTYLFYRNDKLIATKRGDSLISYLSDGDSYWGQIAQEDGSSSTQLWTYDAQQSILGWLDPKQTDQFHYQEYLPYGSSAGSSSIGFNGEWKDPITGWYHLGNGYRVYNPVLMRFHSPDPWTPFATGEINAYAYCLGDPINRVDPSGHLSFWKKLKNFFKKAYKIFVSVAVSVAVGVFTAGAGLAVGIAINIVAGVATSIGLSVTEDLIEGRAPTLKSVGMAALGGLVGGVFGEAAGYGLSQALNFASSAVKAFAGTAAKEASKAAAGATATQIMKGAILGVLITEVYAPVVEDFLPNEGSNSQGPDSRAQSYGSDSPMAQSQKIDQTSLFRETAIARDPVRPVDKEGEVSTNHSAVSRYGASSGVGRAVPELINRQQRCIFGRVGMSQGKRSSTGSGALEALEKKKQIYRSLRSSIRRPYNVLSRVSSG
ncbi:hypothetical protein HDV64DRAFT_289612 [Trichoderma sp. TUCIM 5745]